MELDGEAFVKLVVIRDHFGRPALGDSLELGGAGEAWCLHGSKRSRVDQILLFQNTNDYEWDAVPMRDFTVPLSVIDAHPFQSF